jgi:O-antigen ligase
MVSRRTAINNTGWMYFWEKFFLPRGLPLAAALVLGPLVAFLIGSENLFLVFAVVLLVPLAILFNRYPFMAIMVWMLLMPFFPPGEVGSYILWILHRALIPLALGTVILSRSLRLKEYPPVRVGGAELAMLLYLAIGVVSILLLNRGDHLTYLFSLYDRVFVGFAAYWLVRLLRPREQDLKRLLWIVLVVCVAEIVFGFWSWLTPSSLPPIYADGMATRMSGTFSNPNVYAYVLLFLLGLLFHYAVNNPNRWVRILLMLVFGVGLWCIFLTFTRACWLAGILSLLGLLLLYRKPVLSLILVVVPIVAILSASVFAEEITYASERLHTEQTINSRIILANAGQQMFYAKPFWGWGFGNYDRYDWQFMERVGDISPTSWDIENGTSHNTLLTILAETGAIGFFFYFFPVIWWLRLSAAVWPRLPRHGFWSRRLLAVMWLSIGAFTSVAQAADMRFFWFALGLFWLNLGLVGNMVQIYRERDGK